MMVSETSNCDQNRLIDLLEGTLSPALEITVSAHLDTCESCRHQLESFAADEGWWQTTRNVLSTIDRSDHSSEWHSSRAYSDGSADSVPLDFLAKSDNPAMMGRLGEFEILEPIGCGGMGIVLKGYDHELNRYVAVKVLHPHCATSAAARRRFAREAQAAAAVVHQHVVAIYAVDGQHHPPYLVMPFVPGESLQQRLNRQGPLAVIDVLRIGQQVAEGLAAAHDQGLVHRDIKPGNILLERNVERVLLTDFGLARAADDASLTQSGVIAGTPQFMSPEQTRGDQVDHRTDLFSLGTVMYTLLAGHSPFRAETAVGVLRRVCDDTPRSLREINPDVPDWLEAIIAKLQAKEPAGRFESARATADLLTNGLAHLQQPTHVPLSKEITALVKRPKHSNSLRTWIGILNAAVILTVIGVKVFVRNSIDQQPISTTDALTQLPTANEPIASPEDAEWYDQHNQNINEIKQAIERLESKSSDSF